MTTQCRSLASAIAVLSLALAGCGKPCDDTTVCFQEPDVSGDATGDAARRGDDDLGRGSADAARDAPQDWAHFDQRIGPDGGSCSAVPAPFGCPCESNGDCASGYCVEGPQGFVCTQTCLEDCPDGWSCKGISGLGPDLVFVCMPKSKKLCYPCEADSQCGGGRCAALDDGDYCTYECGENDPCPSTFSCVPLEGSPDTDVCIPDSGSCECIGDATGQLRPCAVENDHGECLGYETCDPEIGWVDCSAATPAAELCDGLDNDCDGPIDEDLPPTQGCEKENEHGTCTGAAVCMGQSGWVCQAWEPAPEVCDFSDNDCDGGTDEDYKDGDKYVHMEHCGTCNNACLDSISNATSTCDGTLVMPKCVVDECDEGYFAVSPYQCVIPQETDCLPCSQDSDCMGGWCIEIDGQLRCASPCASEEDCTGETTCLADEELGQICLPVTGSCECNTAAAGTKRICAVENFLGICYGHQTCDPSEGWSDCDADEASPEVCDGLDNDCNGLVDDELSAPVCQLHAGVCTGSIKNCAGPVGWQPCTAGNYGADYENVEFSCDGLDNDCDGGTDDDLPAVPCALMTGVCAGSAKPCNGSDGWLPCGAAEYGPDYETAESSCDLLDNDCDGTTDEGWTVGGEYVMDQACGNCFTDCAAIYALPHASGYCETGGGSPTCSYVCDDGWYDLNEVLDDGCEFWLDPDAIYVAPATAGGQDTGSCGTAPAGIGGANPCLTIDKGLSRAANLLRDRVLVAAGSYTEQVSVANGIDLLGGYNALNWSRDPDANLTLISPDAGSGHRKTLVASGITASTLVEGFVITGGTAYTAGANSYAIYVTGSDGDLAIEDNLIYAGDGAPGSGGAGGEDGEDGEDGAAGADAYETPTSSCSETSSGGSGGGGLSCAGQDVSGGDGGDAVCRPTQGIQDSGQDGDDGAGPNPGASGDGGWDGGTTQNEGCLICHLPPETMTGGDGGNGQQGSHGTAGGGCIDADGTVENNEWVGDEGNAGQQAGPGGGGGGGGAGGGGEDMQGSLCWDDLGGTGGGGGSGACGGTGGAAGTGGGGSFGIFIHGCSSAPSIAGNTIHRGNGGAGGGGGAGGVGGAGGDGAGGGADDTGNYDFCTGAGGKGGQGGHGGHGGGGGGVAYGIWASSYGGGSPSYEDDNTFPAAGAGGTGGAGGGSLGSSGVAGQDGGHAAVHL